MQASPRPGRERRAHRQRRQQQQQQQKEHPLWQQQAQQQQRSSGQRRKRSREDEDDEPNDRGGGFDDRRSDQRRRYDDAASRSNRRQPREDDDHENHLDRRDNDRLAEAIPAPRPRGRRRGRRGGRKKRRRRRRSPSSSSSSRSDYYSSASSSSEGSPGRRQHGGTARTPLVSDDDEAAAAAASSSTRHRAGGSGHKRIPSASSSSRRRQRPAATVRSASFHDDTVGHFRGGSGTVLGDCYKILRQVGLGTFGRVVECMNISRNSNTRSSRGGGPAQHRGAADPYVAIKIVRNVKRYYESALVEARIIQEVNRRGGRGQSHCCVLHETFSFAGHYCMVFENLGPSLYDFLKRHDYRAFPMICVQDFTIQLLETLEFLHSFRLIHTDLKIENILLMNDREVTYCQRRVPESTRIKVIDFGGACYDHDKKSSVISTRQYRAPEVVLGTGWSMPSDMWSIGCILAELYTGELLFATHDNAEHLALMERMVGYFPRRMVEAAQNNLQEESGTLARQVFDSAGRHRLGRVLPAEHASYVKRCRSLESFVRQEDAWFLNLLRMILVVDPHTRATAHECLHYLARIRRDGVRCC